ncbi:glycine dehydrogenase [Magnaporthiopsis poae ATCC 64411]|uniref:Glycine cleavage system P protein n=1 Tax=Magnaporthiopsis poae (strain ATCC 64411 / 73-15) TaxID=644358 RepID=A0A0C4DQ41_MAGP6|nr:glycine dehydrogenase [Magnaporthiopsis poae ATCC 64411]
MSSWALAACRPLGRLGCRVPLAPGLVLVPRSSGSQTCVAPTQRRHYASPVPENEASADQTAQKKGGKRMRRGRRLDIEGRFPPFRRLFRAAKDDGEPAGDPVLPRPFARLEGLDPLDTFARRHIGPNNDEVARMLQALDPPAASLSDFVQQVIPPDVLSDRPLYPAADDGSLTGVFPEGASESEIAETGSTWAFMNRAYLPNFVGGGYYRTFTPEVIKRNVVQSPAWYTSYTPYQPEISQGRLESLLNFQTMVSDLTALPIANASLLDEATAGAEAMTLSLNALPASRAKRPGKTMIVDSAVRRRTVDVMRGRAEGFGIKIDVLDVLSDGFAARVQELGEDLVGCMVQYPDYRGELNDYREVAKIVHEQGALLSCATELMALTLYTPPGEWGADIAFGSSQRFGVPLGFGGPHAAFFAVADKYKRKIPGRLVGVSKDRLGGRALRLALQTREQHIRREKATSNVCTAQALPANVSAMYAVYHGPHGLKAIAESIRSKASFLAGAARSLGIEVAREGWDTVWLKMPDVDLFAKASKNSLCVVPRASDSTIVLTLDEATTVDNLDRVIRALIRHTRGPDQAHEAVTALKQETMEAGAKSVNVAAFPEFHRTSAYLQHPVFNSHQSETEMMRYIHHLQSKDLSLVHSMIPLGSCTMKLNGSVEMSLLTLPGFANLHPKAPKPQSKGYTILTEALSKQLQAITGMDSCWLEPNSGAQGEFAGLRAIRDYHKHNNQGNRDICLIPVSAHGTNPASAAMAGMRVVPIKCDAKTGNLDVEDLRAKCEQHREELGAIMVTYPSTFGVFEPRIKEVCDIVHEHGGQVYMDGANMNAQVGLCSPGDIGADVCHLNLHKTFCIPHGGGGPGAGPICAKKHLDLEGQSRKTAISGFKFGNASVLPISWAYNALMGADGLKQATEVTLLNANYLLARLKPHYPILYTNDQGRCAHEFILDARPFKETAGVEVIDIAKRLQDYGFHAPTMSFPVAGTLMIEPTESESLEELDRFADALIAIRAEIREVEEGSQPREGNVLKMAPHPLHDIISGDGDGGAKWDRPYSRDKAAYPLPWLREKKFWPSVARVDDTHGDLNLFCTCPPVEDTTGGHDISSVQTSETK